MSDNVVAAVGRCLVVVSVERVKAKSGTFYSDVRALAREIPNGQIERSTQPTWQIRLLIEAAERRD